MGDRIPAGAGRWRQDPVAAAQAREESRARELRLRDEERWRSLEDRIDELKLMMLDHHTTALHLYARALGVRPDPLTRIARRRLLRRVVLWVHGHLAVLTSLAGLAAGLAWVWHRW